MDILEKLEQRFTESELRTFCMVFKVRSIIEYERALDTETRLRFSEDVDDAHTLLKLLNNDRRNKSKEGLPKSL